MLASFSVSRLTPLCALSSDGDQWWRGQLSRSRP